MEMRANYPACYSSKQDIASLSGWNGLFYFFFCAVRKMALVCRNARVLSTSGDMSDRQGTSDFTLKHIGRFQDAKLRKEALGRKLEWLFWTRSQYVSTAVKM
jgi:hypothetical protein